MNYIDWNEGTIYETPEAPKPRRNKKDRLGARVVALALSCAVVGGAAGAGGVLLVKQDAPAQTQSAGLLVSSREKAEVNTVSAGAALLSPAEVYEKNVNSTVGIQTEVTTNYYGYQSTGTAAGSGFILTADGYILTNCHVIDGANKITVALYDGTTYEAKYVGGDESRDVAVLKVEAEGLTPVTLGNSDALRVGDSVLAIGNPLGELSFSLTSGTVSALGRNVTFSSGIMRDLIQTDCAINSGNSGGALFNLYGEVVGITNAKYSSSGFSTEASIDNIGFAIPISEVRALVERIIADGGYVKPYLGVSVTDAEGETAGAQIYSVVENGPAAAAGLKAGDVVTAVNGTAINGSGDLVDYVADRTYVGDQLTLTVLRDGKTLELTATLAEKNGIQSQPEASRGTWDGSGDSGNGEGWNGFVMPEFPENREQSGTH